MHCIGVLGNINLIFFLPFGIIDHISGSGKTQLSVCLEYLAKTPSIINDCIIRAKRFEEKFYKTRQYSRKSSRESLSLDDFLSASKNPQFRRQRSEHKVSYDQVKHWIIESLKTGDSPLKVVNLCYSKTPASTSEEGLQPINKYRMSIFNTIPSNYEEYNLYSWLRTFTSWEIGNTQDDIRKFLQDNKKVIIVILDECPIVHAVSPTNGEPVETEIMKKYVAIRNGFRKIIYFAAMGTTSRSINFGCAFDHSRNLSKVNKENICCHLLCDIPSCVVNEDSLKEFPSSIQELIRRSRPLFTSGPWNSGQR